MENFLQQAKASTRILATLSGKEKNHILKNMAQALRDQESEILKANKLDMTQAHVNGLSSALQDRLFLDEKRLEAIAAAIEEIATLKEPVGRVLDGWFADAGFKIEKVTVPIGVVGVIYESRPNVTADVGALCFKSGNVAILKGGKEAENSNRAIASVLQGVLEKNGLPKAAIALLPDSSREGVAKLIKQDKYVDLIIPRGGESLIRYVSENATVPVVKHDKGLCHTYIDKDADIDKALKIIVNAKCRRTGICGAVETLLIDAQVAQEVVPKIVETFSPHETILRGCEKTCKIMNMEVATQKDWETEYLDNILSIKVVDGVHGAILHIETYGSQHSEAIITENYRIAEKFLNEVDAACVYLNASTQFTDGGEFGFGAEVGISTNKLHARGPMGVSELTTYKYKIYGYGETR
ncbi:MAG: glutamate-5-semialdehyde dehydrogenase [Sulfurovum sp.]|nr:glutamate-5-semialdehyde dehydrogenase [Sulfurovum sp.]MCB4745151.1 glutamate-5-semialdehyde dehydrogenase [Sulfurovum sp.]MCB4749993.1 glutamate-5-semialdehyde dehydrogenase [Sulfurovum sp.]MCB4751386.1 glutamate-5-semialdehyde dehydrogenase [Sulfurovum sp.]MCB4754086.1 glutamate-5-semialdehyde dehydrogenase [Sulfurovum sp.]